MNNIYVDESKIKLYVSKEAPISQDCLYADETKLVSWFEEAECELEYEECQLLLLEDRLAEERKKICEKIRKKFPVPKDEIPDEITYSLNEFLDEIEKGENV